ncbi:ParA family protein [uncultured Limimaricola sp.]|uniref:ParA family protein n=1 Tax=uncultured Limimaricola sp. TaxID=2211667 RepID=UPI0030FA0195
MQADKQTTDYTDRYNDASKPQMIDFIKRLAHGMRDIAGQVRQDDTMKKRVEKTFSTREVGELLGLGNAYTIRVLNQATSDDDSFPVGRKTVGQSGHTAHYSISEIMMMRAYLQSRTHRKHEYLHWRKPGDPLPVVSFSAQKGGTGKSLSAAHFAQYVAMNYGLRVGILDCDPQATVSLYFADKQTKLFERNRNTVASFMGLDLDQFNAHQIVEKPAEDLNGMWQTTQWPGTRLIPGGANIQDADLALLMLSQKSGGTAPVHAALKDAIARWDAAYGPKTLGSELRKSDGSFDVEKYQEALHETVDVIVIDQQPSFTLVQLNGLVAATNLVVPQTMKGFDLKTLSTYADNVQAYLSEMAIEDRVIGGGNHIVLPTIIQEANEKDVDQIVDIHRRHPGLVSQVWYSRSDAVANAAEEYKSIYEYDPPRSRRPSAKAFIQNANAVNDALAKLVWGGALPSRGHAEKFIAERWV